MQVVRGRVISSATDLVGFVACEHLTNLELAATAGLVRRPIRSDLGIDLLAQRGIEHEGRFFAGLRGEGRHITDLGRGASGAAEGIGLQEAAAETHAALRRGDEVIYQGSLFDGRWRGHPDFLIRVEEPSNLGTWSYEVYDTKLARHTKASALLQLCLYSDLLATIQGSTPEWMHVALGGGEHRVEAHRVADYDAYFRMVRRQFESFVSAGQPRFPPLTRPDPVEHCEVCRWVVDCQRERRSSDDLSLVAGITALQRRGFREHAVGTRTALSDLPIPIPWPIEGTSSESLTRVREQARLQVAGDRAGRTLYEILDPKRTPEGALAPDLGLLSLPEPSPGDLFLDIEGDPFALEDGIDYLFGVIEPGLLEPNLDPTYHSFWSRDSKGAVGFQGEKEAFERLMHFLMDRLAKDPGLHIYHYASYERTAMGRLMGRHATREEEVDRLLRGAVLVDLYRAVRQGVRASVESYSIKKMESLYGFERTVDLREAGASMVAFSAWLDAASSEGGEPEILERIEGYNRDDCISTWRLRDWFENRRYELAECLGHPLPRPVPVEGKPSDPLSQRLQRVSEVEENLTRDVSADPGERTEEQQACWLLAQLLSWHRREDKSVWWRYFYLLKLTDEELLEEPEPLSGLVHVADLGRIGKSKNHVHRFSFPPQEHDVSAGLQVTDPATERSPGTVVELDDLAGTIDIRLAKDAPHPTSLVPRLIVQAEAQQDSLLRTGEWTAEHGIDGPGPCRAGRELLLRLPPRVGQPAGASLASGQTAGEAARRLLPDLEGSCLAIQGPPGSGKTTTGGEMIVDLVQAGKRVAVTANSHKVIGNLLDEVAAAARKRGAEVRIGQKSAADEDCTCSAATRYEDNQKLRDDIAAGLVDVAGGTTWVWARPEFADLVDVLFIDEAGQMSLANAVAVAPAGRSLVLLGDPQQLNQPLKGSHPLGADHSALGHLLAGNATMPPHLGLFLEGTWRLHPEICAFTSEAFYEGRLSSYPGRERQEIAGTAPLAGSGIRYLPVRHSGNANESEEEAEVVVQLVRQLLSVGGKWINDRGEEARLRLEDILVITPYNAQVRTIASGLQGIRVGTVDKFQGQQAPIAIYSMATSSPEQAPRGMAFLYNLNRLNVATSRARCISVVVASPELIRVRCHTARQMQLANALCRFIEMAPAPLG